MNYFTKEELEDITKELLENPTRETLQKLNEKYNGIVVDSSSVSLESKVEIPEFVSPLAETTPAQNEKVAPVINPAPTFEIPNIEVPKLETPIINNQNNEPVNFSGNLFDAPSQQISNLMQTTDNFNSVPNAMPTTEVPVSPVPFFGPHTDTANNPIPVGGPVNTMQNMQPTMFGELQQNYM